MKLWKFTSLATYQSDEALQESIKGTHFYISIFLRGGGGVGNLWLLLVLGVFFLQKLHYTIFEGQFIVCVISLGKQLHELNLEAEKVMQAKHG